MCSPQLWISLIVRNEYKWRRNRRAKRAIIFYVALMLHYIFTHVFVVFPSTPVNFVIVFWPSRVPPVGIGIPVSWWSRTDSGEGNHCGEQSEPRKKTKRYVRKLTVVSMTAFNVCYFTEPFSDSTMSIDPLVLWAGFWQKGIFLPYFGIINSYILS
jgi:hypothetical protein